MTEAEWLASTDPQAMLQWLQWANGTGYARTRKPSLMPSDRKLRLWVAAMCDLSKYDYPEDDADGGYLWAWREGEAGPSECPVDALASARKWVDPSFDNEGDPPMALRASLLRDIASNPCRPLDLAWREGRLCAIEYAHHGSALGLTSYHEPVSWLTPQVLTLAREAYETPWRKCPACGPRIWESGAICQHCGNRGRIEDGTIDEFRLAVLADALEESGCDNEEVLRHLRGHERCLRAYIPTGREDCKLCGIRQGVMHGWMRLRGPHVKGCWALDLILGKE